MLLKSRLAWAVKENEIILSRGKGGELIKQQGFIEKSLCEINDLKNQVQETMLENEEVSFEEVEDWGNKYCDAVARYDIPIGEIESTLRSFKEMEKQNATEEEERRMEGMMTEMQLNMKKKDEYKAIKSDCSVLKVKYSKLVITRFNGTHIDRFRFWSQFQDEINRH